MIMSGSQRDSGHTDIRVTVGIPAYNAEKYIAAAVASVQQQSHENIEILISDNGSKDATEEICRDIARRDDRVRYVRHDVNRGMGWNFNHLLELAESPYFMWLCSDDQLRPEYLAQTLGTLSASDCGLVFTDVAFIDESDSVIKISQTPQPLDDLKPSARVRDFLRNEVWDAIYGLARTDLLRELRGMPPLTGDDVILGTKLLLRRPFGHVAEPLLERRMHSQQSSADFELFAGVLIHFPTAHPKVSFPHWRIVGELIAAVTYAPLSPAERARCLAAVMSCWMLPKWRRLPGDVRRNVNHLVRVGRSALRERTA
jgi:glycosyltransferase involved in cell wall biosynthesis